MTDDKITDALAPVRERMAACDDGFLSDPVECIRSAGDVPRLLAAVEKVLALHKPEDEVVYTSCAAHVITGPSGRDPFRFDKMADCPDCQRRLVLVCSHCDCSDWPCATYSAILTALTGAAPPMSPR